MAVLFNCRSSELRDFMFNESRPLNSLSIGILGFGEIAKKGKDSRNYLTLAASLS